jgi:hypothetical protein
MVFKHIVNEAKRDIERSSPSAPVLHPLAAANRILEIEEMTRVLRERVELRKEPGYR